DEAVSDWETTKKRLLAELDDEAEQPAGKRLTEDDRLSVEGTIRITDEVIAQRDRQISELQQMLTEQGNQPSLADKEASKAAAEVLDQDTVVREGRERIAALEKELQDKLRQAEVELSVQRAKVARERTEVDEQQRLLAAEKAALAGQRPGQTPAANSPKKPG